MTSRVAALSVDRLYRLRPRELWEYFKTESAAFWLVCLYLFFEYVRPQQVYPAFAGYGIVRWTLIGCLAAYLIDHSSRKWNLADAGLAVYSLVLVASSVMAYDPSASYAKLGDYFTWILVYLLISSIVNTERRFLFFMTTYMLWCFKMSQHGARGWASAGFGFVDWGTTCAPGFFHNSGECGIQMAMFFPLSLFFFLGLRANWGKRLRYVMAALPVTAVMTIVGSSSRGALLALGAVGFWMLTKSRRYFFRTIIGLGMAFALVYNIIPPEQMQRFRDMGNDDTSQARLTYWRHGREIMHDFPLTGIGYENWMTYYTHEINKKPQEGFQVWDGQLPHNIFIQAGAELGYPGLLSFIALILITFAINRRTRVLMRPLGDRGRFLYMMGHGLDCALIGFLIGGYFVTVLYYPFFWVNLGMTVALYNTAKSVAATPAAAVTAPAGVKTRYRYNVVPARGT